MSRSGSPTGTMRAASIAARYQPPSDSRTASSSTASRPTRWMTTGGGALPARKPGTRRLRASWRAAWVDAALDLGGGHLGLHAHARLGELGDVVVLKSVAMRAALNDTKRGMPRRLAAWLATGPPGTSRRGVCPTGPSCSPAGGGRD